LNPELWPLLVYFVAVLLLVFTMLALSWLLGQRRRDPATGEPFESGIVSVGDSQLRMSVEFYLIAIFFVIFDLETVFIFAWAIAFFELGWTGYFAILVFVVVLVAALVYEWKSGVLDWGVKTRKGLEKRVTR
jgi:NADH-quinone oxidoreductase subunit A